MEIFIRKRIRQVLKGNQEAFGDLVEMYKDRVYHVSFRIVGNRQEAEDIAQEAFLRAYSNLSKYKHEHKFSTWLFRIATNLCIDRLRKKKADYYLDAQVAGTEGLTMYDQLASTAMLPEEEVENIELGEQIQQVMLGLPDKYRTVIVLKYLEEMSLQEISETLNMPLGTVKTRIHRGREALRKKLRNI